jgi:hypothetical protein
MDAIGGLSAKAARASGSGSGRSAVKDEEDEMESGGIYEKKDTAYFQYYALLSHQAQMLQDSVRTTSYQKAILANAEQCFRGETQSVVECNT